MKENAERTEAALKDKERKLRRPHGTDLLNWIHE